MTRQVKKKIDVRIIIDTRERNLDYIKDLKFDKDYGADKIKILDYKIETVKCLSTPTSTGDITIQYRFEGETTWKKTKLSIERKFDSDIFSTLYSSYKRFTNELNRADKYDLDFYIVHNWSFNDIKAHILRLQKMNKMSYKTQPYYVFLDRYLEISNKVAVVQCDDDFALVVRRIIKKFIKDKKLQYL